jgi:hypothetical protein
MSIDIDVESSESDYDPGEEDGPTLGQAGSLHLTVRADLDDLVGTLLNLRALRAFRGGPQRYPIHRVVRCAARGSLEELFDDLALQSGLAAQRFDAGSLLLDGAGVFVILRGRRNSQYISCTFTVWADAPDHACGIEKRLLDIIGERRMREEMFTMDWRFMGGYGGLTGASFEELADPELLDEAYPTLGGPLAPFIESYLAARETVLILQGPPGTGKTRLVRAILGAISRRKGASAKVLYTADRRALESDRIFMQFITGGHDAFVVEDADHILASRANGNLDVHRFLAIADGVVRAQGRKILFTTNLPNVGDIDDALLRPGRCFANVRTRALDRVETARLVRRLCGEEGDQFDRVIRKVLPESVPCVTLAEIYRQLPPEVPGARMA